MKRGFVLSALFLALFVCLSTVSFAKDFPVGTVLEDFKMSDYNGKEWAFKDLEGKKGTIIVFVSAQCPVVKAYDERINQIAADYKAKGINFVGMNSNSTEYSADKFDWMKSHHTATYKFPVLIDRGNVLADKLEATATPEIYLFNADNKLVYHGAIDNDRSGSNITTPFLRTALDQFLAGTAITKADTKAIGCTIKRGTASN